MMDAPSEVSETQLKEFNIKIITRRYNMMLSSDIKEYSHEILVGMDFTDETFQDYSFSDCKFSGCTFTGALIEK